MQATAPAGTLIHIKGAGYRLVQNTLIEGATPFPVSDYQELMSFRETTGLGPLSKASFKFLTAKFGDITNGLGGLSED